MGCQYKATKAKKLVRSIFILLHISQVSYCIIFQVDYNKYVAVNVATSHPHYDSAGNVLNMGTSIVDKGKTKYLLFKIPSSVPGKIHLLLVSSRNLLAFSFLQRARVVIQLF